MPTTEADIINEDILESIKAYTKLATYIVKKDKPLLLFKE